MAIDPSNEYGAQVDTSDPTGYPLGKARNITVPGDGTGTPLEAKWVSDLWGFQQALLGAASLTASGTPDKVGSSQYLTAIQALISEATSTIPALTAALLPGFARGVVEDGSYEAGDWLSLTLTTSTASPRTAFFGGANTGGGSGGSYVQLGTGTGHGGHWRVALDLVVTTDPVDAIGDLELWTSTTTDPTDGSAVAIFTSTRSDSLGRTIIHGEYTFSVSSSGTKLFLKNSGSNDLVVSDVDASYRRIQIQQLSRAIA